MGSLNQFNTFRPPPNPQCALPLAVIGRVCCKFIQKAAWEGLKFVVQAVILLEITDLINKITSAIIDVTAAKTKVDGLKSQLQKLKSECPDDPAIPGLEKQISNAENDLNTLDSDLKKLQDDAEHLQGEISNFENEAKQVENDWIDKCIMSSDILQWVALLITLITKKGRALLVTGQFLLGAVTAILNRWDSLKEIIDNINVPDPDCYGSTPIPSVFSLKKLIDHLQ